MVGHRNQQRQLPRTGLQHLNCWLATRPSTGQSTFNLRFAFGAADHTARQIRPSPDDTHRLRCDERRRAAVSLLYPRTIAFNRRRRWSTCLIYCRSASYAIARLTPSARPHYMSLMRNNGFEACSLATPTRSSPVGLRRDQWQPEAGVAAVVAVGRNGAHAEHGAAYPSHSAAATAAAAVAAVTVAATAIVATAAADFAAVDAVDDDACCVVLQLKLLLPLLETMRTAPLRRAAVYLSVRLLFTTRCAPLITAAGVADVQCCE